MENIRREILPSGILSLSSQRGRCRTSRLQDYRVQENRLPSPPLLNVRYCVRVSLRTVLRNTKEKGVVGNLYRSLGISNNVSKKFHKSVRIICSLLDAEATHFPGEGGVPRDDVHQDPGGCRCSWGACRSVPVLNSWHDLSKDLSCF
jgi:hypothetical protein